MSVFLLATMSVAEGAGATAAEDNVGPIVFFVIVPAIIVLTYLGRYIVIRRVRKLMRVSSGEERAGRPAHEAREVLAGHSPEFVELDVNSEMPVAVKRREAQIAAAQKVFGKAYVVEILIALVYAFVPSLVISVLGESGQYGAGGSISTGWLIACAYFFLATLRFLLFRQQFRAYSSGFFPGLRKLLMKMLMIASPRGRIYINIIVFGIVIATLPLSWDASPQDAAGLTTALLLHVLLIYLMLKSLQRTANLKLTILRVFGVNDAATFTFEGLLNYWRHFGSFFTVVDATFLRSEIRRNSRLTPIVLITIFAIIGIEQETQLMRDNPEKFLWFVVVPLVLLASVGQVVIGLKQVKRNFIRSQKDLQARLARLDQRPRKLDFSFRSMPAMCYGDTWKMTVSEFVRTSNVVLMDLRGFSEERKGCEFEVDFLFDTKSIEEIVFLVHESGLPMVKELVEQRWKYLRVDSPNLHLQAPRVRLYIASDEDTRDIQGILDVLLDAASGFNEQPQEKGP